MPELNLYLSSKEENALKSELDAVHVGRSTYFRSLLWVIANDESVRQKAREAAFKEKRLKSRGRGQPGPFSAKRLREALKEANGNVAEAARSVGCARNVFYQRAGVPSPDRYREKESS